MNRLAAVLLVLFTASSHSEEVAFARDIVPLLERHCASCHLMGTEPGSLSLHGGAAHGTLVDRPATGADMLLVAPGKPEESYLLHKLHGTHLEVRGSGARMPFGAPALTEKDMQAIETWIRDGASGS